MKSKVTIVTLTYNVEKYFERCLKSIFEQDFDNIEFLIVNNCSTDNSMKVLEETLKQYPNRKSQVVIQNNERNMGYCYSMNKGFEMATGDYVTFVDSDDWLEPGSISKCVAIMEDKNYDILQFENYVDRYARRIHRKNHVKDNPTNLDCINAMLISPEIMEGTFWTKFYKTEFVKKSGLKLPPDSPPWSDMCFNVRLFALTNNFGILREPLYHYCENENQTVKSWMKNHDASRLRVKQESSNLRQVEEHLSAHGLLDKCQEGLNHRKYQFKNDNLIFLNVISLEDWINTFPELNEEALSSKKIKKSIRIRNKFIMNRQVNIVKIFYLLSKVKGKLNRMISHK